MKLLVLLGMTAVGLTVVAKMSDEKQQLYLHATRIDSKLNDTQLHSKWKSYKSCFAKNYSKTEDNVRKQMFHNNYNFYLKHNKGYDCGNVSFKLGVNQYTDLNHSEVSEVVNGYKGSSQNRLLLASNFIQTGVKLPPSVDWSNLNYSPPVRDQGMCGSCWAFATSGCAEYHYRIYKGELVRLSQQHLIDCVTDCFGCKGGYLSKSFYYMQNNSVATADSYPYTGKDGETCRSNETVKAPVCIKGYRGIAKDDQSMMEALATCGPFAAAIDASLATFMGYKNGLFDDQMCNNQTVNHAVMVVGYSTTLEGILYWIIQNSWGPYWGEKGFVRMKAADNQCGIRNQMYLPQCV